MATPTDYYRPKTLTEAIVLTQQPRLGGAGGRYIDAAGRHTAL